VRKDLRTIRLNEEIRLIDQLKHNIEIMLGDLLSKNKSNSAHIQLTNELDEVWNSYQNNKTITSLYELFTTFSKCNKIFASESSTRWKNEYKYRQTSKSLFDYLIKSDAYSMFHYFWKEKGIDWINFWNTNKGFLQHLKNIIIGRPESGLVVEDNQHAKDFVKKILDKINNDSYAILKIYMAYDDLSTQYDVIKQYLKKAITEELKIHINIINQRTVKEWHDEQEVKSLIKFPHSGKNLFPKFNDITNEFIDQIREYFNHEKIIQSYASIEEILIFYGHYLTVTTNKDRSQNSVIINSLKWYYQTKVDELYKKSNTERFKRGDNNTPKKKNNGSAHTVTTSTGETKRNEIIHHHDTINIIHQVIDITNTKGNEWFEDYLLRVVTKNKPIKFNQKMLTYYWIQLTDKMKEELLLLTYVGWITTDEWDEKVKVVPREKEKKDPRNGNEQNQGNEHLELLINGKIDSEKVKKLYESHWFEFYHQKKFQTSLEYLAKLYNPNQESLALNLYWWAKEKNQPFRIQRHGCWKMNLKWYHRLLRCNQLIIWLGNHQRYTDILLNDKWKNIKNIYNKR